MTALIRNLATMTRVGLVAPGSAGTAQRRSRGSATRSGCGARACTRSRCWPRCAPTRSGRGLRGRQHVEPGRRGHRRPRRRVLRGVRERRAGRARACCSRSTCPARWPGGRRRRCPGADAARRVGRAGAGHGRDGAAVPHRRLLRGSRRLEAGPRSRYRWAADGITPLAITPGQRLDDALAAVDGLPFGGTDCALPMLYAQEQGLEVDTFVIYTDTETWAGDVHPVAGAPRATAARRASTHASSWSGWSRTGSRSPTRTTPACSTSSGSTRRRPSSSPTSPAARSERSAPRVRWHDHRHALDPPARRGRRARGSRATAAAHAATGGRMTNMKWTLAHCAGRARRAAASGIRCTTRSCRSSASGARGCSATRSRARPTA